MPQDLREESLTRKSRQRKSESYSRQKENQSIKNQVSIMPQPSSALDNPECAKEQRSGHTRGQVLDANSNVIESLDSDKCQTNIGKSFSTKGAPVLAGTNTKGTLATPMSLSKEQKSQIAKAANSFPGSDNPMPCPSNSRVLPVVDPSVGTGNKDSTGKRCNDEYVHLKESDKECSQKSRKMAQNSAYDGNHFPRPHISFEQTCRSNGGRRSSKYGSSQFMSPGSFDRHSYYAASMPHESRRQGRWSSGAFSETPPYRALQDYGHNKSRPRSKVSKNFANLNREKTVRETRTDFEQPLVSFRERSPKSKGMKESRVKFTEEKRNELKEEKNKRKAVGSHEVCVTRQEATDFEPAAVSTENILCDKESTSLNSLVKNAKGIENVAISERSQVTDLSSGLSGLNFTENESAAQDDGSKDIVGHKEMGIYADDSVRKISSEIVQRDSSTEVNERLQGGSQREMASVYNDAVPSGCNDCCQPEKIHYDLRSHRSNGRNAKDSMNESTSSVNSAEIQEEMSRAKRMSLPVNFECDSTTHSAGSHLNPTAHDFSPSLTDGFGNRFSMSSRNGVVYFRPDALHVDLSHADKQITLGDSDFRGNENTHSQNPSNPSQGEYTLQPVDTPRNALSNFHYTKEVVNNSIQNLNAHISSEPQVCQELFNQPTQMHSMSYDQVSSEIPVNFLPNSDIQVNFLQNAISSQFEQSMGPDAMVYTYQYPQITGYEHLNHENSLNYIDTFNSMQGCTSFSSDSHCSLFDPRLQVTMATPNSFSVSSNDPVTNESVRNQFYTLISPPERCIPLLPTQPQSQVVQPAPHSAALPYLGGPLQYFETGPSTVGSLPQMDMTPTSIFTGQQINTGSPATKGLVLTPQMYVGSVQQSNLWQTSPVFHPQIPVPTSVATSTPLFIQTTQRPQQSVFAPVAHTTHAGSVNQAFVLPENSFSTYESQLNGAHSLLPKHANFQMPLSANCLHNIQVAQANEGIARSQVGIRDTTEISSLHGAHNDSPMARPQADRLFEADYIRSTAEKLFSLLKTGNVDSLWSRKQSLTDQDKSDIYTVQSLVGFLSSLQRNCPNMTEDDLKEVLVINFEAMKRFYEPPNLAGNKSSQQSSNNHQGNLPSNASANQIPVHSTSQSQTLHSMTTERDQRRQLRMETAFPSESHNSPLRPFSGRVSTSASTQRTMPREENVNKIATLSGRRPIVINARGSRRPPQALHGRQNLYSASENNLRPGYYVHRRLRRNL